jgi:phage shock protein PspC (stress-responsive transcriptional regulator)
MAPRRFARPRDNRWIAGVCAGLARRFGMSPGTVRVLFVLSCLLPGPQFLVYLALWMIMPNEDSYNHVPV